MTFFVNQTSSTRSSTIFSSFLVGSENFFFGGGWTNSDTPPIAIDTQRLPTRRRPHIIRRTSASSWRLQDALRCLQAASRTPPRLLEDAEKLSSNPSYMQVRCLLHRLIAALSIATDSTHTRRIKIMEKHRFLQCSKTSLSWPVQWRSHANGSLKVQHIPFKNESKTVSYIYENVSKMATDCNIASKIRKTLCRRPQDASKMLWQRFQDASKPHPTRLETARKPKKYFKKPERYAKTSPRRFPDSPTRLQTTPQTPIRGSKTSPRCIGIV